MTVAELFVKCLENEGVKYVFGVPGEENEDLLFALEDSSIQFIPTRHEQGAAFMADVWGRLTGKAGVCLATLGPGATNLITGIADATLDKSPVVAITGQGSRERLHQESHQRIDVVNMFKPITKWNAVINDKDIVTEVVRKAFKLAEMEKPGATHIELPEDVAKISVKAEPLKPKDVRRSAIDSQALEETMKRLRQAKRPLIMAGNGAIRESSSGHLRQLVKQFKIPVLHTFMGKGAISAKDEYFIGTIGLGFKDYVFQAVEESDLILTVGYDIAEYAPEKWNPCNRERIVHIDFTSAEVYQHYQPEVEVVADISSSLLGLMERLKEEKCSFDTEWFRPIRQRIIDDIASYDLKDGEPFTIPGGINIIRSILADEDLLISDVGSHKMWIARNYPTYCPNGCIMSNGLASMGIALPGAVAAALQNPNRRVVAAMGDGGFLMNSQELETARRLKLGFTVVVFNDNDYGLISWKQEMSHGRSVSTRIGNPDFKKYAESYGIQAYRPESLKELREQLHTAIHSKELALVEIPIVTHVNQELIQKLKHLSSSC